MGETFVVGLLKLAKFMYFLAAVISYLRQCAVCISYMPYQGFIQGGGQDFFLPPQSKCQGDIPPIFLLTY